MNFIARPANTVVTGSVRTADTARRHSSTSSNPRPTTSRSANSRSARSVRTGAPSKNVGWETMQRVFLASRSKFVGLAYTILRNKEDAEDAVQDAFLSAYRYLDGFEGRSAFNTWFTRIVVNAALMIRRKRKSSGADVLPEGSGGEDIPWIEMIPDSQPDPEACCAEKEFIQIVNTHIEKMSPTLRRAFTLTYYDEMTSAEAGAALGVTSGTLKSRVSRARQHLKQHTQRSIEPSIRGAKTAHLPFRQSHLSPFAARPRQVPSREIALS